MHMRGYLTPLGCMSVHDAQQAAAEAVALAREAQATAGGVQEELASLRQEVLSLKTLMQGQQERHKEEAQDVPRQQELASQAIWFNPDVSEEGLGETSIAQLAAVREALRGRGMPAAITETIHSVLVLRKKEGATSPAPIVLKCSSLADKVELLRAARRISSADQSLQVVPRLTPWQQKQRKALLPTLRVLKEQGAVVRFFNGHILQRKVEGSWVAVTEA